MSDTPGGPAGNSRQQGIAAAITEVSERASLLIREEIELAKTEITEKTTRLAKGAVVAIVAGVFFLTALFFVLIGCAWLLYYELPIGNWPCRWTICTAKWPASPTGGGTSSATSVRSRSALP